MRSSVWRSVLTSGPLPSLTHHSPHWTLNIQVFIFVKTDLWISEENIISCEIKQLACLWSMIGSKLLLSCEFVLVISLSLLSGLDSLPAGRLGRLWPGPQRSGEKFRPRAGPQPSEGRVRPRHWQHSSHVRRHGEQAHHHREDDPAGVGLVVWFGLVWCFTNVTGGRCNPLAVNREKYSALHLASMYGKEDTVKVELTRSEPFLTVSLSSVSSPTRLTPAYPGDLRRQTQHTWRPPDQPPQ